MKTLLLVRHAKTHSDSAMGKDFDRQLTDRGNREAATMAQRMMDQKVQLDALVSSTAVRALETAHHFHKAYKQSGTVLVEKGELYNAPPKTFDEVIAALDNDWKKVALFAHNPGITEEANAMDVAHVDSMPTSSVFAVTADVTDWKDFKAAEKRFLFFDFPKMLDEPEKK